MPIRIRRYDKNIYLSELTDISWVTVKAMLISVAVYTANLAVFCFLYGYI